jgi:RNA polymerase sigma factor (sigma-70 family)
MAEADSTCWTLIQAAAAGSRSDREQLALRYSPVVRAYLGARWRASPLLGELDDAVQEVFVECFRAGGILDRVEANRPGGFRAFLYGVLRNIALRFESSRAQGRERVAPSAVDLASLEESDPTLSHVFDRAWAAALLREAGDRNAARARTAGDAAMRRIELLRLRFQDDLPIREIARLWGADAAELHHEYATARQEFKEALLEVVAFHRPGTKGDIERECADLLSLLG